MIKSISTTEHLDFESFFLFTDDSSGSSQPASKCVIELEQNSFFSPHFSSCVVEQRVKVLLWSTCACLREADGKTQNCYTLLCRCFFFSKGSQQLSPPWWVHFSCLENFVIIGRLFDVRATGANWNWVYMKKVIKWQRVSVCQNPKKIYRVSDPSAKISCELFITFAAKERRKVHLYRISPEQRVKKLMIAVWEESLSREEKARKIDVLHELKSKLKSLSRDCCSCLNV